MDRSHWITAFNQSNRQSLPVIMSGIEQSGDMSALAQRLQRAWVYYVPFVFLKDGDVYNSMLNPSLWLLGEKTANSSNSSKCTKAFDAAGTRHASC